MLQRCTKICFIIFHKIYILFNMIGLTSDVEEVYFGEKGALSSKPAWSIAVDMTTTKPSLARTIFKRASELGVESLDAPVSGGDIGARNATLAIMVGGKEEVFKEVIPLFSS